MPTGASIRIFLPAGDPEGTRIVTRSHWTGSALVCPRTDYPDARFVRSELDRPGIYVLIGPPTAASFESRIYIGETEVLRERIDQHHRDRDFWTQLIAFTSSDGALNKALVKYIESSLVKLAIDAGRSEVENGNRPPRPALSEADLADAEAFLGDMLIIYPLLGVGAFEARLTLGSVPTDGDLFLKSGKAEARGREISAGFVVFAGSTLGPTSQSLVGTLAALRQSLLEEGKLTEADDGTYELHEERAFQSPSYAASFVVGRAANGRSEWKNAAGVSLNAMTNDD